MKQRRGNNMRAVVRKAPNCCPFLHNYCNKFYIKASIMELFCNNSLQIFFSKDQGLFAVRWGPEIRFLPLIQLRSYYQFIVINILINVYFVVFDLVRRLCL